MEHFVINDQVLTRLRSTFGSQFSRRMVSKFATATVAFSKERFVKKDWINKNRRQWTPRKRPDRGSLMVKTGRLKRSIRKMGTGVVGTDVSYGEIHNFGGKINKTVAVKAHTRKRAVRAVSSRTGRALKRTVSSGSIQVKSHNRKMNMKIPKRQFLGESVRLNNKLQTILSQDVQNELNRL